MYHVLKPHWFENDNIKIIVDQTQKIGLSLPMPDGSIINKGRAITGGALTVITHPISLYMSMLKNSIITEPTITNDHLRKVQMAADFMVLPFNYTANLKRSLIENIVGPSLKI